MRNWSPEAGKPLSLTSGSWIWPRRAITRSGSGQVVEAHVPFIPHGERGGKDANHYPEDTLPVPRCTDCRDRIFYERGAWFHREIVLDKDHDAEPETWEDSTAAALYEAGARRARGRAAAVRALRRDSEA